MNIGFFCMLLSAILIFLSGIGANFIPNQLVWALFAFVFAHLIGGKSLSLK